MRCPRCDGPIDSVSNAGLIMGPVYDDTRGEIRYICEICWRSLESWFDAYAPLRKTLSAPQAHRLDSMCPHCGELVPKGPDGLTPYHDWPKPTRQVCPGSKQNPRNPESDGRLLWNGEHNPHFYRNKDAL